MRSNLFRSCVFGFLALSACAVDDEGTAVEAPAAANSLGITRFTVDESADTTTVTGFNEAGTEVGRLELVHGVFELSPAFADDYPGEGQIDGRRVHVFMNGTHRFSYETKGYEPIMRLPAHPAGQRDLAAFLSDPHVKPALDRWGIGWETVSFAGDEESYVNGTDTIVSGTVNEFWTAGGHSGVALGTTPTTNYGSPRTMGGSAVYANTCGGSGVAPTMAIRADRMRRDSNGNLIGDGSHEWIVTQVCADPNLWFGRKSCSLVNSDSRSRCQPSSTSTAGCSNCGSYDGQAYPVDLTAQPYSMSVDGSTNLRYCWGSTYVRTLSTWLKTPTLTSAGLQVNGIVGVDNYQVAYGFANKSFTLCLNAAPTANAYGTGGIQTDEDIAGWADTAINGTALMDVNHSITVKDNSQP
jgi:hypothetical protein